MSKEDFEAVQSLQLTKPIQWAGEEVTQLNFREPEAELLDVIERVRLKQANPGSAGQKRRAAPPPTETLAILSWFTGIGAMSLKRLVWKDTQAAMAIVADLVAEEDDEEDDDDALGEG